MHKSYQIRDRKETAYKIKSYMIYVIVAMIVNMIFMINRVSLVYQKDKNPILRTLNNN